MLDNKRQRLAVMLGLALAGSAWSCGQKNGNAPKKTEGPTMASEAMTPGARRPATKMPGPYPPKWIAEARTKHRMSTCFRLVYKKGCTVLRKGRVTLQITLAEDGTVKMVETLGNTVRVDPKLVLSCFKTGVAKWRFTPPKGVLPSFTMQFELRDKC